jgi:hypothetical protein
MWSVQGPPVMTGASFGVEAGLIVFFMRVVGIGIILVL